MARYRQLYTHAVGQGSGPVRRHMLGTTGSGSFPRSLCDERVVLRDDKAAPLCRECRLIALTELSLALEQMGLLEEAVAIASHVTDASFETAAAQSAT